MIKTSVIKVIKTSQTNQILRYETSTIQNIATPKGFVP